MFGLAVVALGVPVGITSMVCGARLSERTLWGYGLMAIGILYAAYGLLWGFFLILLAREMRFN